MKIFNEFIDLLKKVYILSKENLSSLLKAGLSLFIIKALSIILIVVPAIIILSLSGISIIALLENDQPASAAIVITYLFLILFSILILILFAPVRISAMNYGAIILFEKQEYKLNNMFKLIKENYFKLLWGNILISIILMVILPLLYLVGLIVIIPLSLLTIGVGTAILNVFIRSSFTYWSLFSIKDKTSPFTALEKNINIGFNKLTLIVLSNIIVSALYAVSVSVLGVFAFLASIVLGLFSEILIRLAVLKIDEISK